MMKAGGKSKEANSHRILVVRCDRLGDVLLSTPVFEALKHHHPRSHVVAMVRPLVKPVLRGLPSLDDVIVYEPESRHRGLKGFIRLVREIRRGRFRVAIVLQSQWRLAAALFLAGVRHRVGPLSKPHSYLFYNKGMRQRRSLVEMHEADYNLQLLRKLGIRVATRKVRTRAHVSSEALARAREWLAAADWDLSRPGVAVHPGMGGSALNWPESHYIELVKKLLAEGNQVLVTGGPLEGALLERIRKEAPGAIYTDPAITRTVEELGALLAQASVVVAPSTGPLHLAVALGVPVVTFFPPIRVQSALRWGPYLGEEDRASVLVPEVYCGEEFKCRGSICHYYPCMRGLTVHQALDQVRRQLEHRRTAEVGGMQNVPI